MKIRVTLILFFVAVLLVAAPEFSAVAATDACSPPKNQLDHQTETQGDSTEHVQATPQSELSGPAPGQSELTAYIDPETGELTDQPPPGSAPAPDTTTQSRPDLVEVSRPDGSTMIRLDDRYMTPLKAKVTDGKLVTCHEENGQDGQLDEP
ncbi:MAG: hypothetical protein SH820_07745 [Xanthomonadales bacterium]|nr:hypothetical protein [Xanthomonadales bacterium]